MRIVTVAGAVLTAAVLMAATLLLPHETAETANPGAIITVNSTADTNVRNGDLTLREAMLLATGGLSLAGLSEGECGQIAGANWTPPNPPLPSICLAKLMPGAGAADTITFDPIVFNPATITIGSQLPWLSTGGDTIDGSTAEVTVRATSMFGSCIIVDSDGNTIKGLMITNCFTAVSIYGNDNLIGGTSEGERNVISGNANGIWIAGDGNQVKGNYIGTDASGTAALTNSGDGVRIDGGAMNVIGGGTPAERNVISGNSLRGVVMFGGSTDGNTIEGNYIGTNASGTAAIPNGDGVFLSGSDNVVGGAAAGERNVISGNDNAGVAILGFSSNNVVKGNYIGTNYSGTVAIPNDVGVSLSGSGNVVGGTAAGERNAISGNDIDGVQIDGSGANGNVVKGNHIGTNASGAGGLANIDNGVRVSGGAESTIVQANVISGNPGAGVRIQDAGTAGNVVKGNYIGTNASGAAALPNGTGVLIRQGPQGNVVGGTAADERNVISGNSASGVRIALPNTTGNSVRGNYIGTNASGTVALPNEDGVVIGQGAHNNTIGGGAAGDGNVISGNRELGVMIGGMDTDGNVVRGNYIGTDASGNAALPNAGGGLLIFGSADSTTVQANVISGNWDTGVTISGAGTVDNVLRGNYIGTNASGAAALGNGQGVWIRDGAQTNTVGGSTASARNVISGNWETGVTITLAGTEHNVVRGNYIGIDASGAGVLSNGGHGVEIGEGASENTLEANLVSGNSQSGVVITGSGASANVVKGNYIGTDASGTLKRGNSGVGVYVGNGAWNSVIGGGYGQEGNVISGNGAYSVSIADGVEGTVVKGNHIGVDASGTAALGNRNGLTIYGKNNTVGGTVPGEGNIIAFSTGVGVSVDGPSSTGNSIRGNSIHSNAEKGIHNSDGGNTGLTPPIITGLGSVEGTACAGCTIDVYSDDEDEGRTYEGSTTADSAGNWTFPGWPQGPNATVTATDADGNTSEFSAPVAVPQTTPSPTPTATPTATATSTPSPTATATPTASPTPTPGVAQHGDTDCDGDVDSVDSLMVLRDTAELPHSAGCIEAGDVDCDGDRDSVDALFILRHVAGLPVDLPPGCGPIGE